MTTLAEDRDSWKAHGVIRRDFRHSHDGEEVTRHIGRKKNGKRWCRGKVGREHTPVLVHLRWHSVYQCRVCGKHTDWLWHTPGRWVA